ncbi:hypothetical protein V498_00348 [Pseudogymnoascus sp. VKM F-4517 (FW-2822)]|nr:hypothetical protein V498_00348 [Pseudogymnoascus sp. VKM F-4517 (FW-2822)]
MAFSIAEPAPTPLLNHYTPAGRGGAGNMYKPAVISSSLSRSSTASSSGSTLSKSSSSSSTSSLGKSSTRSSSSSTQRVFAGRGGAGNVRPRAEEEPFSFAEEVREQTRREQREKTFVVGRGGAGNYASKGEREGEKRSLLGRIGGVLSRV